jgi:enamine deaminase RidA (YjgF/YER057c/UK114 family)
MTIFDDVVWQCEKAFDNVEAALREADATLADIVRVTYILPDPHDFKACWPTLQRRLGAVRPAATMLSAKLIDPRIRIEIEVTARKRRARRG